MTTHEIELPINEKEYKDKNIEDVMLYLIKMNKTLNEKIDALEDKLQTLNQQYQ